MGRGGWVVLAVAALALMGVMSATASVCSCGQIGVDATDLVVEADLKENETLVTQGALNQTTPSQGPTESDPIDETVATGTDTALEVYGTVTGYWPKTTPGAGGGVQLMGLSPGGQPVPGLPNPEGVVQPRPQPSDKPPGPPSEDEVRDTVEEVTGGRHTTEEAADDEDDSADEEHDNQTLASQPKTPVPAPMRDGSPPESPSVEDVSPDPPPVLSYTYHEPDTVSPVGLVMITGAGIAAVSIVTWFLSQARVLARFGGLFALFSRQTGSEVLKHPARAQIHSVVSQNSGINSVNLSEATGLPSSSLRYHVAILQRENLIRVTRRGRIHHYHEAGGRLDEQVRAREFLFWRGRGWLASAILQHPGSSQQTVARLAGLPASRVCEYTKELAEAGLVRSERVGRCRRYFPTSMLEDMFASGQLPTRSL